MWKNVGLVSAIAMPFFNIPLIIKVVRCRTSENISLTWAIGVWACIMGMVPSSVRSTDIVLASFGIVNAIFFTGVLVTILFYHPALRKSRRG